MKRLLNSGLILSLFLFAGIANASTLNVNNDVGASCSDVTGTPYCTIQAAVDAAVAGDTISISAGTYDEQVVITKSLTLQGSGDTTIIQPSSSAKLTSLYTTGIQGGGAFFDGIVIAPIIKVSGVGTAGVVLNDFKVDGELVTSLPLGAGHVSGIVYGETGGTINNVTVEDTNHVSPTTVRTYSIWADAVGATSVTFNVTNSRALLYGRNGINARGNSITVNFTGNTVTGPGTVGPDQVPNGILLISGADGTVTNNTISANHFTGATFLGSGILLFQAGNGITVSGNEIFDVDDAVLLAGTSQTSVTNNSLHNNVKGVQIEQAGATNNSITDNTIADNTYGIFLSTSAGAGNEVHESSITGSATAHVNNESATALNATHNWWGTHASSTFTALFTGTGLIEFDPWYVDAAMTSLSNTPFTLTLNGDASMTVFTANGFTDPGVTATGPLVELDPVGGVHNIDPLEVGTHVLEYTATDVFGRVLVVERTVTVLASSSGGGGASAGAPAASPAAEVAVAQATVIAGEVLGAFTIPDFVIQNMTQAQIQVAIAEVKTQLTIAISQLISLLQAQLAAAIAAGGN